MNHKGKGRVNMVEIKDDARKNEMSILNNLYAMRLMLWR